MAEVEGTVFSLSKKEIMGGKVYEPGWYTVRIDDLTTGASKNLEKPSINFTYSGTILQDENGDKKYEDHPLTWMFNSRALGFTKGFLQALGIPEEDITEDKRFDFKAAVGKTIDIMIENELFEGRKVNRVNHKYRAVRTA